MSYHTRYELIGYELSTEKQERPALWGIYAPIVDTDTGELCTDEHEQVKEMLFVFIDGKWVNMGRYYPVPLEAVQFSWSPEWEEGKYLTYDDVKKANKAQKGDSA